MGWEGLGLWRGWYISFMLLPRNLIIIIPKFLNISFHTFILKWHRTPMCTLLLLLSLLDGGLLHLILVLTSHCLVTTLLAVISVVP